MRRMWRAVVLGLALEPVWSALPVPPPPSKPPSVYPTASPTAVPSRSPSARPSASPMLAPSLPPSALPSGGPSSAPTAGPAAPSVSPTRGPSTAPTTSPSAPPTGGPMAPSASPSSAPTASPSSRPTVGPAVPSASPTGAPTAAPTAAPSTPPTVGPAAPTAPPSAPPTAQPSATPSTGPQSPSVAPTATPSTRPTAGPKAPTVGPVPEPTRPPIPIPTASPDVPSATPSVHPTQVWFDECTRVCPTCADKNGSGNICVLAGQTCEDPSHDTVSYHLGDWHCVCAPPARGHRTHDVADCHLDECADNQRYSEAGCHCGSGWMIDYHCYNPDPSKCVEPIGPGYDTRCMQGCCNPDNDTAMDPHGYCFLAHDDYNAQKAGCNVTDAQKCAAQGFVPADGGHKVEGPDLCRAAGQECYDPVPEATSTGDWGCRCWDGTGFTAGAVSPTSCKARPTTAPSRRDPTASPSVPPTSSPDVPSASPSVHPTQEWFDECKRVCPTCADKNGSGNVCEQAGQTCEDPSHDTLSYHLGDWHCVCPPPARGHRTHDVADCHLDECADNQRYSEAGCHCGSGWMIDYHCYNPDPSKCVEPIGPGYDTRCMQGCCNPDNDTAMDPHGYCYLAHDDYNAQKAGCNVTDAQKCAAQGFVPADGGHKVEGPDLCRAAGQECYDPVPEATSTGDWGCRCPDGTGFQKGALSTVPCIMPTQAPTTPPSSAPSARPTEGPVPPSASPSIHPSAGPRAPSAPPASPSVSPTRAPTATPVAVPTLPPRTPGSPSRAPARPTVGPSVAPTPAPSAAPVLAPTLPPVPPPTAAPARPTRSPTAAPSRPPSPIPEDVAARNDIQSTAESQQTAAASAMAASMVATTAVAAVSGSAAGGLGAAKGGPGLARLSMLARTMSCPDEDGATERMDMTLNPLQIEIGSGPAKYADGAVVGNTGIVLGFVFFCAIALQQFHRRWKRKYRLAVSEGKPAEPLSWSSLMIRAKFPWVFMPAVFLFGGISCAGCIAARHGDTLFKALGVADLVFFSLGFFLYCVRVGRKVPHCAACVPVADDTSAAEKFFFGRVEWVPIDGDEPRYLKFAELNDPIFSAYIASGPCRRIPLQYWLSLELIHTFSVAAISTWYPATFEECVMQSGLLALIPMTYAVLLVVIRPYTSHWENVVETIVAVLESVMMLLLAVVSDLQSSLDVALATTLTETAGHMATATMIVIFVKFIGDTVIFAFGLWYRWKDHGGSGRVSDFLCRQRITTRCPPGCWTCYRKLGPVKEQVQFPVTELVDKQVEKELCMLFTPQPEVPLGASVRVVRPVPGVAEGVSGVVTGAFEGSVVVDFGASVGRVALAQSNLEVEQHDTKSDRSEDEVEAGLHFLQHTVSGYRHTPKSEELSSPLLTCEHDGPGIPRGRGRSPFNLPVSRASPMGTPPELAVSRTSRVRPPKSPGVDQRGSGLATPEPDGWRHPPRTRTPRALQGVQRGSGSDELAKTLDPRRLSDVRAPERSGEGVAKSRHRTRTMAGHSSSPQNLLAPPTAARTTLSPRTGVAADSSPARGPEPTALSSPSASVPKSPRAPPTGRGSRSGIRSVLARAR